MESLLNHFSEKIALLTDNGVKLYHKMREG